MSDTDYYPPPAFAFVVTLVSSSTTGIDAAFQEISGVDPHIEIEEVTEGGLNAYVHQLPGVTKHSNLVMKRGYVTQSSALAEWAAATVGSSLGTPIRPQVLKVDLIGANGQPLVGWTFQNAWPVKWEVGPFDAKRNDVLTETMEFAYSVVVRSLYQQAAAKR